MLLKDNDNGTRTIFAIFCIMVRLKFEGHSLFYIEFN